MNKTKRHILLFILVFALLALPTLVVFAKELGALTITGPGIKGELSLTDPNYMMKLEQSGFFNQSALTKPPENLNLDAGYTILAKLNLDGKITPYVQMVYYPTTEGQPSYVHYISRLQGETLKTVDEWDTVSAGADKAFRSLMTANNITLQSALVVPPVKAEVPAPVAAEPAIAPVTSPATIPSSNIILAVSALIMLLVGAGLVIRRRTVSASS